MPRPDRLNRLGLLLLGLLLVAAGGYGLARSYGALGHGRQHDPVLIAGLRSFIAENRGWFWWGAGATCVLITLIGLAWLRAQLHLPLPANDDLTRSDGGPVRLKGGAAAGALAADVESLLGVAAAKARIWGEPEKPEVYLRVQMHDGINVEALRRRIERDSLQRLRNALQVDTIDAQLDLRIAQAAERIVR